MKTLNFLSIVFLLCILGCIIGYDVYVITTIFHNTTKAFKECVSTTFMLMYLVMIPIMFWIGYYTNDIQRWFNKLK